jgi:hypothetical protein
MTDIKITVTEHKGSKMVDIFNSEDELLFNIECLDNEINVTPVNFTHYPKPIVNGNCVKINW